MVADPINQPVEMYGPIVGALTMPLALLLSWLFVPRGDVISGAIVGGLVVCLGIALGGWYGNIVLQQRLNQ